MSDYVSRREVMDIIDACRFEGNFRAYAMHKVAELPGITVEGEKKPRWHVEERIDNKKDVHYVIADDDGNYCGVSDDAYMAYKDGFLALDICNRLNGEGEDEDQGNGNSNRD